MLLESLRLLRGYVRFEITGRYPERFINITARGGVHIWDVKRCGEGFSACMYMSDYLRIRQSARRSGVLLRITAKRGMPSFVRRYRGRVGAVIGACAFALTVFFLSMFIWSVDITGLETISQSEMRELLYEHGIYIGAFKPSLDYPTIAREIMIDKSEIGWMAINVTGSYASVEVKEESPAPKVAEIDRPCNIKAERDGRILSIDAEQGAAAVTEGSGVVAGQLIVSGVTEDAGGGVTLIHSSARVMAQTERTAEFTVPVSETVLMPNGEMTVRKRAGIMGLYIPYVFGSPGSPRSLTDSYAECPAPLGMTLPLADETELVYSMEPVERTLDYDSAEELLLKLSKLYEAFDLSDCRVIDRSFSLKEENGEFILSVTFICVEDIAVEAPIETDEGMELISE